MRLRETVIVSGGLLSQQITVFLTGILVAHYLGATGFGQLAVLKGLSTFVIIVTPLGLDLALLKHASYFTERSVELDAISKILRLIVSLVNILLSLIVIVWVGNWLQTIYRDIPDFSLLCSVTMLGIIFAADIQISGALYRVADRVTTYSVIVNYIQPSTRLIVTLTVLWLGGSVLFVVIANTIIFVSTFLLIAFDNRIDRIQHRMFDYVNHTQRITEILSDSLWMALLLLMYQAMRFADVIVLAALTSAKITGEYTAMSSVAQIIQIYPSAISQTLGPTIARLHRESSSDVISEELQRYLRKAALLGGFLFGGIAVFGVDLDLVFGKAFEFSWQLAVLLSAGWYVSATLAPFGYVLSMTGRHRQELAILSVGALVLVASLFLFVPWIGNVGAAVAVFFAFTIVNSLRCAYVIRILGVNPLNLADLYTPICFIGLALSCSFISRVLGDRSLIHLIATCTFYMLLAGTLYIFGLASRSEREAINRRFGKAVAR